MTGTQRRRLDAFSKPDDENCTKCRVCYIFHVNKSTLECLLGSRSSGQRPTYPAFNRPIRIHCKTGSLSARLVFETRAECQDFVARYKDDGTEKLEDDLRLFGKLCPQSCKKFSQSEMLPMPSMSPALDVRSQILSILDRRNGVGETSFQACTTRTRTSV